MSGTRRIVSFTRLNVPQQNPSKDYPGNSWIDTANPFYDPWVWGANSQDPPSYEEMSRGDGGEIDMDAAGRNNFLGEAEHGTDRPIIANRRGRQPNAAGDPYKW